MYVEHTETRSMEHRVLSDKSLGGWRGVCHSPEEDMATRCTKWRQQAVRGNMMLWLMVCLEILGHSIDVGVSVRHTTSLNSVKDQVHQFIETVFLNDSCSFRYRSLAQCQNGSGILCGAQWVWGINFAYIICTWYCHTCIFTQCHAEKCHYTLSFGLKMYELFKICLSFWPSHACE